MPGGLVDLLGQEVGGGDEGFEEAGAVPGADDEESVGVGFLDAELVGAVVPDGFVSEVADGDVEVLGLGGVVGPVYRVVAAEWFG
ncbi:hypothetical protein ACIOWG_13755 [Streptomyces sp. NPDC087658]|uniref:hypothetical protein n=1 Tax=Streptomyces sp. NPDC087658 TaxID=3365800 RepID=UPI00381818D2